MTAARAAGILVVACVVGQAGCRQASPEVVETETVVPVVTTTATVGTIRAVIHATGDVSPSPNAELLVVAPERAQIVEITKGEGDVVRQGEVLVRFEMPAVNADVVSKAAEVTAVGVRVDNAKANQTRMKDLFDRGVAARKEVEDADREVADAEAALSQARATADASRVLAARQTVHATFNGVVAKRFHNPGDVVEGASSDPILRVIDPTRLQVDASISIADVSRIVVGATARLVGSSETPIPLKVVSRPAAIEPGTAAAPIRLAFLGTHALAAGTPVAVEIDAEEHRDVVLVPAAAIVREGEDTTVFVAAGNKAERRPVVVGLRDATHVEIRQGVTPGERVIVRGQAGLPDGAAIALDTPGGAAQKPAAASGAPASKP